MGLIYVVLAFGAVFTRHAVLFAAQRLNEFQGESDMISNREKKMIECKFFLFLLYIS